MRRLGRTGHKDLNHDAIVEALRKIGASVWSTAGAGYGAPDAVVGYHGATWLLEFKDGAKPPSARKLSAAELAFRSTWRGGPLVVVTSPEQAVAVVTGRHQAGPGE